MFRLAHSLFLIRFFNSPGLEPTLWDRNEQYWQAALGETYRETLSRLRGDGYLVPASLLPETALAAVQGVWGTTELKAMSRARGLKVTRRKEELAAELLARDFPGVKVEYESLGLLALSEKGRELAEEYHTTRSDRRRTALELLVKGQYGAAVKIAEDFENSVGFPRGELQINADADDMVRIMTATPSALTGCSGADLQSLREYIALCSLGLPLEKTKQELQASIPGIRFDFEVASRMLLFNASHKRRISQSKSAQIQQVEILFIGDNQSCEACRKHEGEKFALDEVPDLPRHECTSVYGCRCMAMSVIPQAWLN